MTNEQREALVSHWLEVELDEAEDARTLAGPLPDDYREGVWHVLSDQLDDAHEALVTNNWRKVEREADALLQAAGLAPLDHEGAEFERLCRRLLFAKQEYLHIEADRMGGDIQDTLCKWLCLGLCPTTGQDRHPIEAFYRSRQVVLPREYASQAH